MQNNKLDDGISWLLVGLIAMVLYSCLFTTGCSDVCTLERPEDVPDIGKAEMAIIGGEYSEERRAAVKVYLEKGGYCTGTVLTENQVLTAAHCLPASKVCIRDMGCWPVVYEEAHPQYTGKGVVENKGDVAVLFVSNRRGELPPPFAKLSVEEPDFECYAGELLVQGYGRGSGGDLAEREVYEIRTGRHFIYVTEGPCFGDSGSALLVQAPDGLYVAGVATFVRNDDCSEGKRGWGGAYTKLTGKLGRWVLSFQGGGE